MNETSFSLQKKQGRSLLPKHSRRGTWNPKVWDKLILNLIFLICFKIGLVSTGKRNVMISSFFLIYLSPSLFQGALGRRDPNSHQERVSA